MSKQNGATGSLCHINISITLIWSTGGVVSGGIASFPARNAVQGRMVLCSHPTYRPSSCRKLAVSAAIVLAAENQPKKVWLSRISTEF